MISHGDLIAVAFFYSFLPDFRYNQLVQRLFYPQFSSSETVSKQGNISLETGQKEDKSIPRFSHPLYFCLVFQSQTIGAHIATAEKTSNRKSNPLTKKGKKTMAKIFGVNTKISGKVGQLHYRQTKRGTPKGN